MSKLSEFYGNLVDLCGIQISTFGRLVVPSVDESGQLIEIPLKYDGLPIIFPEKQYINDPENKDAKAIVLHPLSESSLRAPSEVQEVLRKAAIVRLCSVGDFLLKRAIELNHNATMDESFKLNHTLSSLFQNLGGLVDVKFFNFAEKLLSAMTTGGNKRLFNIYFKQQGEVGKNMYNRVCVISSPLYDALKIGVEDMKLFGIEIPRKKDIQTLILVMESLWPELANNGYIVGSSSPTAPTLVAFMEGMSTIAKRFNTLLQKYGKEAKGIDGGTTKGTDWDREQNLTNLRHAHPIEEYNIGVGKEGENESRNKHDETPVASRAVVENTISVPKRETRDDKREERSDRRDDRRDEEPPESKETPFWEQDDDDRRSRRSRDDYDDRRGDRRRDSRDRSSRDRRDDHRRDYGRDRDRDRRDDRYNDRRDDRRSRDDRPFWEV